MNSEKVKEIKKALEDNKTDHLPYIDEWKCKFVEYADILTLINELESENETLKFNIQETEKASFNIIQMDGNLVIENQQLKDRIAELEKEIEENAFYSKGYAQGIKNTYEVVIPEKLKQFAERLKDSGEIKALLKMTEMPIVFMIVD